jgi:hypothetical protein
VPKRNAVLEAALHPVVPERVVQRDILELLHRLGVPFWRIGQRDARGTQDPGVPDLVAVHRTKGLFWVEVKRSKGGRQSPDQRRFQDIVEAAGGVYLLADNVAVVAFFLGAR